MLGLYRRGFGFTQEDFPGARDCGRYSMAIPLHNRMTLEDYEYVVKTIKNLDGR
jgi:dTDP-4-amino-4,6-dideoxygalactose transaminase